MHRKNILAICAVCVTSTFMLQASAFQPGSQVNWEKDFLVAKQNSMIKNRPIMIFFTMNGCRYCDKLQQRTLTDTQIIRDSNSRFVPVKLMAAEYPALVEKFKLKIFPSVVFLGANGDELEKMEGFGDAVSLEKKMMKVLTMEPSIGE